VTHSTSRKISKLNWKVLVINGCKSLQLALVAWW